jgi:hypothetical protein
MESKNNNNPKYRMSNTSNSNEFEYLSLKEASEYSGYSQDYLNLRIRQGKLKGVKIGRNWVTKKEWIDEYKQYTKEYFEKRNNKENNNSQKNKEKISQLKIKSLFSFKSPKIAKVFLAIFLILAFAGTIFAKGNLKNFSNEFNLKIKNIAKNTLEIGRGSSIFLKNLNENIALGLGNFLLNSKEKISEIEDSFKNLRENTLLKLGNLLLDTKEKFLATKKLSATNRATQKTISFQTKKTQESKNYLVKSPKKLFATNNFESTQFLKFKLKEFKDFVGDFSKDLASNIIFAFKNLKNLPITLKDEISKIGKFSLTSVSQTKDFLKEKNYSLLASIKDFGKTLSTLFGNYKNKTLISFKKFSELIKNLFLKKETQKNCSRNKSNISERKICFNFFFAVW